MVFVSEHPDLSILWHPLKNEGLLPTGVFSGSNKKVWWLCDKGHEWEAQPNSLKRTGNCPFCNGSRVLVGFNDFASTHPELAKEWHLTKNGGLLPTQLSYGSKRKVWWHREECGHEWEATVGSRAVSGQGCAVCRGLQVQVGVNDLATTHPEIAAEWHPTRNGDLLPTQLTYGSARKVWWYREECGHEWEVGVINRTNGNGCYQCLNRKKAARQELLSEDTILFSELHPHKNRDVNVAQLTRKSNKKVWWLGECGHEWEMKVASRTDNQKCAVCAGSQVMAGVNDLATLSPVLSEEWHKTKNSRLPTEVTVQSHFKAIWTCKKGHEWEARVQDRFLGSNCPVCAASVYVSRAERVIAEFVASLGLVVETSVRNVIKGELDIYVPEKKVAIEFNGLYWHSEMFKGKDYHYGKWKACKDKGIQLIQVWEDDWNRNPELVKRMLAYKLGSSSVKKVFARQTRVVEVSSSDAKIFLADNHLQGYRVAKYFGLVEKKSESESLVAVLGVAKKGDDGLEIIRFATSGQIMGGFSKLLSHVLGLPEYVHVRKVFSYSHNDHSDGGVYLRNGFELVHEGSPGYNYWSSGWVERKHRLNYSPSRIKANPDLVYKEGLDERGLAELNKLVRVWDSGSSLWVKKVSL